MILTLGHSPDVDDVFMFYGIVTGKVSHPQVRFQHVIEDIQSLNQRALREELDVTAISFHAYPFLSGKYEILPCGFSVGDGYGPILVAKEAFTPMDIARVRVAIPGTLTSAFLALALWADRHPKELNYVVVPFDRIMDSVISGEVDAGLLIHEGQLTYREVGLVPVVDLGAWWKSVTGLPLPLGGNVIHVRVPARARQIVAKLLRSSIEFAIDHAEEATEYAMRFGRGISQEVARRFIQMYVNKLTLDADPKVKSALEEFFHRAYRLGVFSSSPCVSFVEPALGDDVGV